MGQTSLQGREPQRQQVVIHYCYCENTFDFADCQNGSCGAWCVSATMSSSKLSSHLWWLLLVVNLRHLGRWNPTKEWAPSDWHVGLSTGQGWKPQNTSTSQFSPSTFTWALMTKLRQESLPAWPSYYPRDIWKITWALRVLFVVASCLQLLFQYSGNL